MTTISQGPVHLTPETTNGRTNFRHEHGSYAILHGIILLVVNLLYLRFSILLQKLQKHQMNKKGNIIVYEYTRNTVHNIRIILSVINKHQRIKSTSQIRNDRFKRDENSRFSKMTRIRTIPTSLNFDHPNHLDPFFRIFFQQDGRLRKRLSKIHPTNSGFQCTATHSLVQSLRPASC